MTIAIVILFTLAIGVITIRVFEVSELEADIERLRERMESLERKQRDWE